MKGSRLFMAGKGLFITLEGGEGVGKTTMLKKLAQTLEQKNISYIITREPGGIMIAEKIREVILDSAHTMMDARTEALLYAAARRQHLVEKVAPALHEGKVVLCDRFIDSSLAYQGYARGLGIDEVLSINAFAIDQHMPDFTFYLDMDPLDGLARIVAEKGREINRLDLESIEFHQKVRAGYNKVIGMYPNRIKKIDAARDVEQVAAEMNSLLIAKLEEFSVVMSNNKK
jgi:dTMP kinase